MSRRPSGKPTRKRTAPKATNSNPLARFLEHPSRPPETLRYHELQGFLFAVVSAPELIRPSEWMPEVFGGAKAGFETLEEAQAILPELMALYNAVNGPVFGGRATLPPDCRFRRNVLANLDEQAPISMWSRGFLSFFASRRLAESYRKELRRTNLVETATIVRRAFPAALAEYAHLGRTIDQVVSDHAARNEPPAHRPNVGRNEPCPCGSGRKYKKCCGASA